MIPGPDLIYACPQCKGYISTWSILSGNTHNAILYSDLKEVLPMLPTRNRHGKCSCCQHLFWMDQLKFIGEYDPDNSFDGDDWPLPFDDYEPEEEQQVEQKQHETKSNPMSIWKRWKKNFKREDLTDIDLNEQQKRYEEAGSILGFSIDDYELALINSFARSEDEELYLRRELLWKFNDRTRNGKSLPLNENEDKLRRSNINELISKMDESNEEERLFKADLYRSLGDFENSKKYLDSITDKKLIWYKHKYLEAVKEKRTEVFILSN